MRVANVVTKLHTQELYYLSVEFCDQLVDFNMCQLVTEWIILMCDPLYKNMSETDVQDEYFRSSFTMWK